MPAVQVAQLFVTTDVGTGEASILYMRNAPEMTLNIITDEGRLTIAMGARQVELATTIHSAIAVIISFALE